MRWTLMIKAWSDGAWEDFEYWMKQNKKTSRRILQLLKDIGRNGYERIGKVLNGDLTCEYEIEIPNDIMQKYVTLERNG